MIEQIYMNMHPIAELILELSGKDSKKHFHTMLVANWKSWMVRNKELCISTMLEF